MEPVNSAPRTTSLQQLFGGKPTPPWAISSPFDELHARIVSDSEKSDKSSPVTDNLRELFGGTALRQAAATYSADPPAVTSVPAPAAPAREAAPTTPPPALNPPPRDTVPAAAPIDPTRLLPWEGMFIDPATGEGIVLQNRDSELGEKTYLRTGWFFERPTQSQPAPGRSLEDRSHQERISPLGFLTEESTKRLMSMLAEFLPPGAKIQGIGANNPNSSFPVSVQQREILVSWGDRTLRFPAGSLARQMCNYTFLDGKGEVRQNTAFTLRNAVEEMQRYG